MINKIELMRSQIVTVSSKRNVRFMPYAFTEHGAIMAATILNSPLGFGVKESRSRYAVKRN